MDTILVGQIFEFVEYIIATGAMLRSLDFGNLNKDATMARWS